MVGCSRFPLDVDSGFNDLFTNIGRPGCPVFVDTPEPLLHLRMTITIFKGNPDGSGTPVDQGLECHHIGAVTDYMNFIYQQAGIYITTKCCRNATVRFDHAHTHTSYSDTSERCFNRRFFQDNDAHINVYVVQRFLDADYSNTLGYTQTRSTLGRFNGEAYIMMAEIMNGRVFNLGRFANTLAHEIGHLLGITQHNNVYNTLMYYAPVNRSYDDPEPGNEILLLPPEIVTVRDFASRPITPWSWTNNNPAGAMIVLDRNNH